MNYLAHAYLSFNDKNLVVGNFIADHLKRGEKQNINLSLISGVKLHRHIDAFTDSHPLFIESKRFFYKNFERYSGILTDIYYDHLLAKYFIEYSDVTLREFTDGLYNTLNLSEDLLNNSSKRFLKYVNSNDTFFEYSKVDGIQKVLNHLSYRINHNVFLDNSLPVFLENENKIRERFHLFMDDIINETKRFISNQ